ncbi:MAG: glycoside hydrolase family 88 protein, partial [Duncaniella sp.]|nr:glycoside hydrolase family 88 protein [Duncaniella sp.]
LIENCYFSTGEDCIAIMRVRNRYGRRAGVPTENVIVRKCQMKNGHGGIVIGSEISGGFKNLFCEDCDMDSPSLDRVVRIKTNSCRGGVIEDVFVRNIRVGQCREAVLKINLIYDQKEICQRDFPPTVRNVYLDNVNCEKSKYGVRIEAYEDVCKVFNVEVKDCKWNGVATDGNSIIGMVDDVRFINLTINGHKTIENEVISTRMALSEMKRCPYSWMVDHSKRCHWSYSVGAELEGILALGLRDGNKEIQEYAVSYIDSLVGPDGMIKGYRPGEFNIDHVKNGRLVFAAYDQTKDPRLLVAADTLWGQLMRHPRTKEGNFWHKKIYPHQVWLDGLYMGQPFYLEYANRRLSGKEQKKVYDDVARQFLNVAKHTYDPATGLYRHAWDESKSIFWADKKTGQSKHAWGRAQGWFIWALVDVLEMFPQDHPKRKELVKLLQSVADGIVKYQDPETGVWYQVLDEPGREGNYLEATASAMYVANILRAVRLGLLPDTYLAPALKGYQGILDQFVSTADDGTISLEKCCAVSGLGPETNLRRDGSFEYYLSEPIRPNDGKGVGAFILAAIEAERLGK